MEDLFFGLLRITLFAPLASGLGWLMLACRYPQKAAREAVLRGRYDNSYAIAAEKMLSRFVMALLALAWLVMIACLLSTSMTHWLS